MGVIPYVPPDVAQKNVERLGINFSELPQLPPWANLFGAAEGGYKTLIAAKVMGGSALLGRELTQPEKDALAHHYAQLLRTKSFDVPIGAASSLAFYYHTYKSYGFPLYTPKQPPFDPNKFLLLQGALAQKAWHGVRFLAWYTGCRVFTALLCLSYAVTVHEKDYASDPRLQNYRREAAARQMENLRQQAAHTLRLGPPSRQTPTTGWAGAEQSTQDVQDAQDAQPTWSGTQSPQPESPPESYTDEPYVFDDASAVSPAEQQGASTRQQSTQGGSSWDRIRAQARGGGAAQGQGFSAQAAAWGRRRDDETTSQGAQQGTSYTFSSADEERAYAKEQAQKEFDEMLEKERQGQSDTSGRRW